VVSRKRAAKYAVNDTCGQMHPAKRQQFQSRVARNTNVRDSQDVQGPLLGGLGFISVKQLAIVTQNCARAEYHVLFCSTLEKVRGDSYIRLLGIRSSSQAKPERDFFPK
jgi:hypothetical protein